jgi:hypothetical protein
MPSPKQWQAAIEKHGFPLKMDTDFEVTKHSGYLPCEIGGKPAGFEYSLYVKDSPEGRHIRVELVTHADLREFLGSAIAAAVLAEQSGGTLEDPQEGKTYKGAAAIAYAREAEVEIQKELTASNRPASPISPPEPTKPWWKFW